MAAINEKDYYSILGVSSQATTEEIRRAFQKKARKLHPDINKSSDAEQQFKEVSEAYAVLSDEAKRRRYDALRSGNPFAGAQGWAGSSAPAGSSSSGYDDFSSWGFGGAKWGSPFEWGSPFGGSSRQRTTQARSYNPKVGADVVYQMDFDFDAAKNGTTRGITYNHFTCCDSCHGKGSAHANEAVMCPTCSGSGRISVDLMSILGFGALEMVCPECEGTGKVVVDPCDVCSGSGRVLSASEILVTIPADSHDGDVVRLASKGNAGTNGQAAGDFVFRIGVPSERLEPVQAFGFRLFGVVLPFFIYNSFFSSSLWTFSFAFSLPMLLALYLIFSRGILKKRLRWWKSAGRVLADGLFNGFVILVFLNFMASCMSGRLFSPRRW